MPLCWMANMISIRITPMKKVAFRLACARYGIWKENSDQVRIPGVSAATPSWVRSAVIASCAVLPALAPSHSTTRGDSAVSAEALAVTQSMTICESAAGIGKSEFNM